MPSSYDLSYDMFKYAVNDFLDASPEHREFFMEEMAISPATLERWGDGRNAPHRAFRKVVLQFISEHICSHKK